MFIDEDSPTSKPKAFELPTNGGKLKGQDMFPETEMYTYDSKGVYELYVTSTQSSSQ